jgi:hypothetical protein
VHRHHEAIDPWGGRGSTESTTVKMAVVTNPEAEREDAEA